MINEKASLWQRAKSLWQTPQRRVTLLVFLRYALPLISAPLLLLLGVFYNVSALQQGRAVSVSVLRLMFNTFKNGRRYLLSSVTNEGARTLYTFLIVGAVLLLLFFAISLAVSIFAFYTLWRVRAAELANDATEAKRAKILFCAFVPNRVLLAVLNAAVLALALYPELMSFICTRFLAYSGGDVLYVRFNPVLLAVSIPVIAAIVLAFWLSRREGEVGLDLFAFASDGETENTDEACEDDEEDENDGAENGEVADDDPVAENERGED